VGRKVSGKPYWQTAEGPVVLRYGIGPNSPTYDSKRHIVIHYIVVTVILPVLAYDSISIVCD